MLAGKYSFWFLVYYNSFTQMTARNSLLYNDYRDELTFRALNVFL